MIPGFEQYEAKKQRLLTELAKARAAGAGVVLRKDTSNLFRPRNSSGAARIDVRDFNGVIHVDPERRIAEVEGMATYEAIVDATLAHGLLPPVVPELKSITLGGATTGLGIESSSFRHGLVHETVEEMEILLANGSTVVCRADNEHRDLFHGFPNSYGTFGYALRLRIPLIPAKRYVHLQHLPFTDSGAYFRALAQHCAEGRESGKWDYVDGTVFDRGEMFITLARFVDEAPHVSDYKGMSIYYRSIREKREDYLTAHDYIWRWDTDWFWCSKHFLAQHPLVRPLVAWTGLRSTYYWKIMRWNRRWLEPWKRRLKRVHPESVIQDIQIPIENCAAFLEFFHTEIGIKPVWVCPMQCVDADTINDLYPLDTRKLYMNFGFWDFVHPKVPTEPGHYNRLVEHKVGELGGKKSLYSTSYYSPEEFWELYNRPAYDVLKRKYDPDGVFKDLYAKCVRQA